MHLKYKNGHCHHHNSNVPNLTRDTNDTSICKKKRGQISNFTYNVVSWNNDASAEEGISLIKLKLQSLKGEETNNSLLI